MSRSTSNSRGRKPQRPVLSCVFSMAGFVCCAAASAADDAYLELLDQEVAKVESSPTDTARETGDPAGGVTAEPSRPAPSREQFELLLRTQNVGTYSFYRRLPERSREEVFLDYGGGASMEALRSKIIDRYLHP